MCLGHSLSVMKNCDKKINNMSTKKKGILTSTKEWAKHLKKWGKRIFWKKERRAGKQIKEQS